MADFDTYASNAASHFGDAFGESGIYKPKSGGSRAVVCGVERVDLSAGGVPNSSGPMLYVTVNNSATTGIASDEINTGGDLFAVAERIGSTPVDKRIVNITDQDAGQIRLELR